MAYKSFEAVGTSNVNIGAAAIVSAAKVLSSRDLRLSFVLTPVDGDIYLGSNSSLTKSNGIKVSQGSSFDSEFYNGEVWAVCGASTSVDVRYWEEY